jgi:protocatechuate 3,4-dioxygenase beta subunit
MVFPCGSLTQKVPDNADTDVRVKVGANLNVIYWAAEEGDKVIENPWIAYSEYSNAGVVRSDQNGNAVLRVRKPASYKVPSITGRVLAPHIHYRTCDSNGLLSRVETVYVNEAQVKK